MSTPAAGASPLTGPPLAAGRYTTIKVPGGTNVSAEGVSDSGTIVGCDSRKRRARIRREGQEIHRARRSEGRREGINVRVRD
ncbi:MAG TPA: hypothetical protein VN767_18755 [Streptosporangiaceae bacterium]|nr:hypothetical protein [Streptosporangiaceae bacterium]